MERGESSKTKEGLTEVESVLFIPHTPGSRLARLMQEVDDSISKITKGKRIRIVERRGDKVIDQISKADPWEMDSCSRESCMVCMEMEENDERVEDEDIRSSLDSKRKVGGCGREGVTYIITCHTCAKKGRNVKYIGETSRTGYIRGLEHLRDKESKKDDSPLAKHDELFHSDRKVGGRILHGGGQEAHQATPGTAQGVCIDRDVSSRNQNEFQS